MDVLSTSAGSAQAVREAAAASEASVDSRLALERELDRLNAALGAHAAAAAQHLSWTLLAQSFLLTSYLIVLVGGWSLPLPGKRWLLAAIAAYGIVSLLLGALAQRGGRDRLAPLRQGRRLVEEALERVASRPPVFSREGLVARALADWATRLLPVAILSGWTALSIYTLALPLPGDGRPAVATVRGEPRAATPPGAGRAKAPVRKGEEGGPPPAATEAADPESESGLAALFRRAMNPPSAPEGGEAIKP